MKCHDENHSKCETVDGTMIGADNRLLCITNITMATRAWILNELHDPTSILQLL
jgi:hypothetical protein